MSLDEPVIGFNELAGFAIQTYCDSFYNLDFASFFLSSLISLLPHDLPRPCPMVRVPSVFPSVDTFRQLTTEQFVKLSFQEYPSAEIMVRCCEFVKKKVIFGTTFLALQEGLAVDLDEAASLIVPSTTDDKKPEEVATTTGTKDEKPTNKSHSRKWPPLDPKTFPKEGDELLFFVDRPLIGQKLQIAWALKEAGILSAGSTSELDDKADAKVILCGWEAGEHPSTSTLLSNGEDRLNKAPAHSNGSHPIVISR